MKKDHWYYVLPCTPNSTPTSIASIFEQEFKYRERIGGLDAVSEIIFGDVLLSRFYSEAFIDLIGLKKPRGFIPHGPSDTGKTLIAKTIADILKMHAKIVSGPELFNRLLGESETKVGELFKKVHSDQVRYSSQSPLHIIVFDKIDAIRNSMYDSITTQILTEIDGMLCLGNILIIGTTNIIEVIDPTLFHTGRLDILIEVGLPDRKDRPEVFQYLHKNVIKKLLTI